MEQVTTLPALPARPLEGHKGMFGRVLIVGGSDTMIGAPVLAGTSALRCGAGLVQVAVPKVILPAAISITPELIGLALRKSGGNRELLEAAQKADAIVIGPGLGQSPAAAERLKSLARLDKQMVVDADGLNLLAAGKRWPKWFKAHAVLTPHPGEMGRLAKLIGRTDVPSDEAGRIEIATQAAQAFGQIVVLKGYRTVVTDGQRVYINDTGDSSLSKAGTGDVLSGVVGTLLAQKMERLEAAIAAVWLHGRAGELAGQRLGCRSVLARDVIESLGSAVNQYPQPAEPS
ncbi:MAG TPA: NAD(P)H-hydrate dehydratase [Tepidisphaeraceae bacterium]|nr:NAD(P)H-hydrate dehydratase [Tepidisphaeraceae bacterium]